MPSYEKADRLMKQAIAEKVFPGGVLLVARKKEVVFLEAYGLANIDTGRHVKKQTLFDLASLTKPLATTLALIILVQKDRLRLDRTLGSVLPAFKNNDKESVTIRHLLGHFSGLPDYKPYYRELRNLPPDRRKDALREFLVKEPLIHPIGETTLYSDIGFMILCWVVEHVSGKRLDHFIAEEIYRPLGIDTEKELFFVDLAMPPPEGEFAATERCPWRKVLLNGLVHDDNAYVAGGIEGHAGLFGTAEAVGKLLLELCAVYHGTSALKLFQKDLLHTFFRKQGKNGMALGFDVPSKKNPSCGRYFSEKSVGHLGFTGTSFWMDPEKSVSIVLLTNRVHPSRDNEKIKLFRPEIHNAVMNGLGFER